MAQNVGLLEDKRMKKLLKRIGFAVLVIAIPLLIDIRIFGNSFPSNIETQSWAGFLGSYEIKNFSSKTFCFTTNFTTNR